MIKIIHIKQKQSGLPGLFHLLIINYLKTEIKSCEHISSVLPKLRS